MDIFLLIISVLLFLILYNALLYPLILMVFSKLEKRRINISADCQPTVSVIISAYNEEEFIADCVESVLNSNYPEDKIKVLVGSDGSDDRTYEIVKAISHDYKNLDVYNFPRSGKNTVLNNLCENIDSELMFFMDADIRLAQDTLLNVTAMFGDESIGSVICGMKSQELESNDEAGKEGESLYQKYEDFIRLKETELGTTVSSLGAFYGIRAKNYKPLPDKSVLDDLMPLIDTAMAGQNVIYTDKYRVQEVRPKSYTDEFGRRERISAAGFATLRYILPQYDKLFNKFGFFLISHKVIRWFWPHMILLILFCTPFISNDIIRNIFIIFEFLILLFAIIGYYLEKINLRVKVFRFAMLFVGINISFMKGFYKYLTNNSISIWKRDKIKI